LQLYRLVGVQARVQLSIIALLVVLERLVFAAAAIGITGRLLVTWAGGAAVVAIWSLKGLLKQRVTTEIRRKVTMLIAEGALLGNPDASFLPGGQADAAIFDGRHAAEKVLVQFLPALVGEPIAAASLLYFVKPTRVPIVLAAAMVGAASVVVAVARNFASRGLKGAYQRYMLAAEGALTSVRAATDLVASGHERAHLERLRKTVDDWTREAARAERNSALFERIPFAAVVVVGVILLVQSQSLELRSAIRLGVFFPPLAGLTRTIFELLRRGPRVQTLGPALDAQPTPGTASSNGQSPTAPFAIACDSVNFAYAQIPVLENVSFVWKPGEIVGIRGPNGSGKSTLLKLLLGLVSPTSGKILLDGTDLQHFDLSGWRRSISYLPQRPYVPEKATILQALQLTIPDLTRAEAKHGLDESRSWDSLARIAGTGDPLQVPVASLSVGMRQRVMLARVLARPAAVVLLDEPDENLDSDTRVMLGNILRSLAGGRLVAIATHDESILAITRLLVELKVRA
jgi:ABC-type multidrug transport system fused ATPase/permease subunit